MRRVAMFVVVAGAATVLGCGRGPSAPVASNSVEPVAPSQAPPPPSGQPAVPQAPGVVGSAPQPLPETAQGGRPLEPVKPADNGVTPAVATAPAEVPAGGAPTSEKPIGDKPEGDKPASAANAPSADDEADRRAGELLSNSSLFPFTFSLPDLKGKKVSLKKFSGKVVIVDFWGTWCPPCRKEIPHFVALQDKYEDEGLQVVGLNYENVPTNKRVETIRSFVESQNVNYPCLIGDPKTKAQVPEFRGYPTTLFIDRKGKVRAKLVGYHPMPLLESLVKRLLEEG